MKQGLLIALLYLFSLAASAQAAFRLDSLPDRGLVLDKGWRWHLGDDPAWAEPGFDDARWDTLNPMQNILSLTKLPQQGIGWLRLRLDVSPQLRGKMVSVYISQAGATEVFLNGQLTGLIGKINGRKQVESGALFQFLPLGQLRADSVQVIAVRYAFSNDQLLHLSYPFFFMKLILPKVAQKDGTDREFNLILEIFFFAIFMVLGLLQLLVYVSSPGLRAKSTLSLSLFLIAQSITHLTATDLLQLGRLGSSKILFFSDLWLIIFETAIALAAFFYLLGIYQYFRQPKKWPFFIVAASSLATTPAGLMLKEPYGYFSLFILGFILPWSEILRISVLALKQNKSGAKQFTIAHGILLGVFIVYTAGVFIPVLQHALGAYLGNMFELSFLGLAFTISLLLSQEQAAKSRLLQKQLIELESLSRKTIAQEQEKQHLLATQNERLEEQVEQRTAELKASQTQLIQKEKMASLGELTAGIAHEIQNPLNFVNNFSEISTELVRELRDEEEKADRDPHLLGELLIDLSSNLQKINHHGSRASAIVSGMLEHSRSSTGEKRPTDLNLLADEYLKLAYQGLRAKDKDFNAELITDFRRDLGLTEVVPQEIGRVLLNLYNNAFYAVQQRQQLALAGYQPTVTVSTSQVSGQHIEIRVGDNGTGIPESVKAKIFQPFFTTKPTGEGTGLGLSLSYDIITKGHGGSLTVNSEEGEGTTFIIQLPGARA